jgi:hypothetical protein
MALGLLTILLVLGHQAPALLTLEIRVFDGIEEVTRDTRVAVHRTGERGQPLARVAPGEPRPPILVEPGLYDVQVVREREGRVVNIRWAERLVVMPYPDEGGRHLEVINFASGYGALQVRAQGAAHRPGNVALFPSGDRSRPAVAVRSDGYTLFVVPAGHYDVQVGRARRQAWFTGIEVPLDRTRMWVVP